MGLTCVVCHEPHGIKDNDNKEYLKQKICIDCHDKANFLASSKDEKHYPCPEDKVTCADCHMPKIVKSGGAYTIRSHAFKIVTPDMTEAYKIPNSCQNGGCHDNKSVQWAKAAYQQHYIKTP